MIKAGFYWDKNDGDISVIMDGHAGAGEPGKDLVCASVSALAETVMRIVKMMDINGYMEGSYRAVLKNGCLDVNFCPKKEYAAVALSMILAVELGMDSLAMEYPEYISLEAVMGNEG